MIYQVLSILRKKKKKENIFPQYVTVIFMLKFIPLSVFLQQLAAIR